MKIKALLAAGFVSLLLAFSGAGVAQAPAKPDILEVIEISGVIREHTARSVAEAVERVNESPKIKGVLLVVNSPGGGVAATQVIVQELSKVKVPVVAMCEYECASGGVYLLTAPSIKYIAVREDTIGGSVGVIVHMQRFHRLLDWAKIDSETYTSGSLKDVGNPTRSARDDERKFLQGMVDQIAERFYAVVAKARGSKVAPHMAEIKTAKIFVGGHEIVRVGLADAVMDKDGAIKKLKDLSGSKNAFTRDELKKITKDASEAANMSSPIKRGAPQADGWVDHLAYLVDTMKEVRAGQSVSVEYRMPYRF